MAKIGFNVVNSYSTNVIPAGNTLWNWGRNNYGQLGDSTIINRSTLVQTIAGGTNWSQVSAGDTHTAAIKTDGTLWNWGRNNYGQLGDSTTYFLSINYPLNPITSFPVSVETSNSSFSLANHVGFVKTDGTLWLWGNNFYGQFGDNTTTSRSSPVQTIAGGTNWKQVAGGSDFTAAVKTDGTLWLWGLNQYGQLGDSTRTDRSSPVQTITGGTNWKQVAGGLPFVGAIKTDGTLWTWGQNAQGQLGDSTRTNRSSPVQTIAGGTNWKQVAGGNNFTAASKTDGTLWLWGRDNYGQLGDNTTTTKSSPVQTITGGTNWSQFVCTLSSIAAVKTDGTLWTWGINNSGQLGDSTRTNRSSPVQTIAGGTNWKQVSGAASYSSAAIKTDGTLWLWGLNQYGKLGDSTTTDRSSPVQTITGGTNWKQVSCGNINTAASKTDGTLWTWGDNTYGQLLYNNSTADTSSPVQTIAGGTTWSQVAGGSLHTAAIKTDGTLWLWGYTLTGQIGDSTITNRSSPVQTIAGGTNWSQVGCGQYHTAAVKTDGTLWTWGNNSNGALGDNTRTNRSSPVQTIAGGTNWKQVAGGSLHTAAIKTDGTLWNWGQNIYGQLGDSTTYFPSINYPLNPITSFPVSVETSNSSFSLAHHVGFVKTDGTLWLWGLNQYGKLGDSTTTDRSSPVQTITGGTNWKQVAGATDFTAAVKTDGTLWLWGANFYGNLGDSTRTNRSSPVQTIAGGTNWKQVAGGYHTAAVKTDGTLWTWGYNAQGQLGDSTRTDRSSPVQTIAGGTNWKQVGCGYNHTAAVKTDGTLWTWGYNFRAQLGDSTITNRSSPVQTIAGGTNWKQVAGGSFDTEAVKTDGTLWLWGQNLYGNLGDSTRTNRSSPVQTIAGGTNWKQVSGGNSKTTAIKTDGTLWSWGYNFYGQLGDSTLTNKSSPVQTIAGGTNWSQFVCTLSSIAAVKTDGTLWTWGINNSGQLLYNNSTADTSSPVQTIAGGTNWKQVAGGYNTPAAIKTDGTLWLWGRDNYGQLGDNTTTNRSSPVQTIAGGTNWSQVSAGDTHTAAIKTDGTLWNWGRDNYGQLGDNTIINRSSPVQTIAGGTNWKQVAGGYHTAVISNTSCDIPLIYNVDASDLGDLLVPRDIFSEGGLWNCGYNGWGQLGDNTTASKSSPVQTIAGGTNWKQVAGGDNHTAAIKTDGTLWSWGIGNDGALGESTRANKSSPVQTNIGGTNWKQVACGYNRSTAIKTDGTLWLWGHNVYGQLGDSTITNKSSPVQTIAGGTNWKQVGGGVYHTAAINTDGTLWTWGQNIYGALGDSTTTNRSIPVQTIAGGTNWKQVAGGAYFTAAIKTDGTLWTWGDNNYSQLGNSELPGYKTSPVQTIAGGTTWKQVAGGYMHTAAIKTDGTLWTWGYNLTGQIGDNTIAAKSSPVQTIAGGTNWKQVACGYAHTVAIKTDGSLWSWGYNIIYGQLGNSTTVYQSSPVQTIAGGTNWKQATAGKHTIHTINDDM